MADTQAEIFTATHEAVTKYPNTYDRVRELSETSTADISIDRYLKFATALSACLWKLARVTSGTIFMSSYKKIDPEFGQGRAEWLGQHLRGLRSSLDQYEKWLRNQNGAEDPAEFASLHHHREETTTTR